LSKPEIRKLAERTHKTGYTLKIIDIFINHRRYIKITVGLVKLMKKVDKKTILKEKDQIRDADREIRNIVFK
jgi:tmRNA-binding protein